MDTMAMCEANYSPLTPITFLKRASNYYTNRTSIIFGQTRYTWSQTYDRCCRLAASLLSLNIAKNDVVSVLASNIPAMYELHFAVPMAGAVLNPINTRLDAKNVVTILRHAQPKILFIDREFESLAREALRLLHHNNSQSDPILKNLGSETSPLIIFISDDYLSKGLDQDYEDFIRTGEATPSLVARMFRVDDELDPISLNYTSGTTADPKGVVVSHRGAYLSALSVIMEWEMGNSPVYLWILPMFHCNGWTITWSMAARGGTNVCMRHVNALEIYKNIDLHGVTHMGCVPTVFKILFQGSRSKPSHGSTSTPVKLLTGGSSPPAGLIEKIQRLGFEVMHSYGLTEASGSALFCEWQNEWNRLPESEQMQLKTRQGLGMLTLADVDVKNTKTQESVPHDGKTTGEIVIKGSSIMKGYFKNPEATSKAFKHGWLNTGDVAVIHPNGYIEIKDRSKDIIISGGENISSIEVENVLYTHKKVGEVAVVAMPHAVWGETPCAFIVLKNGFEANQEEEKDFIKYCRENMPHYMCPRKVVFLQELPKNGNGKIIKPKLRDMAKELVVNGEENAGYNKVQQPEEKHCVDRVTSRL